MAEPGSLELALSQRQRLAEGVSSVSGVLEGWGGVGGGGAAPCECVEYRSRM